MTRPLIHMRLADLMSHPRVYRAWQAPFAHSKLQPFLASVDLSRVHRVLDIGCGPGTNAPYFSKVDYTGVDISEDYVADAKARHHRDFRVGDATELDTLGLVPADVILINSLLHHLDDAQVDRALDGAARLLTADGSIHILDLVLPPHPSPSRWLARMDRGLHARPVEAWRRIFSRHFAVQAFEPYMLGGALWSMVYFRGQARI